MATLRITPLKAPGRSVAHARTGEVALRVSGPVEVIEEILGALEAATGEQLPPPQAAPPMAGQTEIYDVPGV